MSLTALFCSPAWLVCVCRQRICSGSRQQNRGRHAGQRESPSRLVSWLTMFGRQLDLASIINNVAVEVGHAG